MSATHLDEYLALPLGQRVEAGEYVMAAPGAVARWLAAGASALGLVFVVAVGYLMTVGGSDFIYGVPSSVPALLAMPVVMLTVAAGAVAATVAGWRGGAGVSARTHQVVLLAGIAALTWFLATWNLLGWHLS